MPVIDFHNHYYPPRYMDALRTGLSNVSVTIDAERNPVLQYAGVNYLMSEAVGKPIRVLSIWSKKLEALGLWYDHLLSESLGKQGRGATPMTVVHTRDLHARGQQLQDGPRDKMVNNLVLKTGWSLRASQSIAGNASVLKVEAFGGDY